MILIGKESYYKLNDHLKQVTFNNLFARSVLENRVNGRVYVDNENNLKTFYIVHSYGMSLLFGDSTNAKFNSAFRAHSLNENQKRNSHEWMQAYPNSWDTVLKDLFKDSLITAASNKNNLTKSIVELNTRINFRFNKDKYLRANKNDSNQDDTIRIIKNDKDIFDKMTGSVVPKCFWNSSEDFNNNGIGYGLYYEGKLAATSFSSFFFEEKLELGIETVEEYRGKGFAQKVCAALIDYCIENNLEPVWACRLENTGSYRLAQKLGFEPSIEIPYYRLSN